MASKNYLNPLSITLLYLVLGITWILFSDQWVSGISSSPEQLTLLQTWKGWFYVFVTAVGLFILISVHRKLALQSAELLTTSEKKFENLFHNNPYPIVVCETGSKKLVTHNKAFLRTFGYTEEQAHELKMTDLFCDTQAPALNQALKNLYQENEPVLLKARKRTGQLFNVEVNFYEIPFNQKKSWLLQIRDVTIEMNYREQLRLLTEHLERTVEERTRELKLVNEELEAFTYSVSHDLRAPLRAIDGFSKAIKDDSSSQLSEESASYLERVRKASQKVSALIEDLLRLSRITRSTLTLRSIDLSEMAEILLESHIEAHRKEHIRIQIEPGLNVLADEGLIQIALDNLLSNAIKYSSSREVSEITIGSSRTDGDSAFFVRDNGIGLDVKYESKIYKPFQRLHTDDEFEGFGVGLATAKRVISRHGGRLWVDSTPGHGATFYFTLPESLSEARVPAGI
jgi:PAS domain S-box-containing protein